MQHFGIRQLLLFMLLLYIAVLAVLKYLDLSTPNPRSSERNSRDMTRNSTAGKYRRALFKMFDKYVK